MRIIKYVFLLLILALFAATVYVATQKGTYDVERSLFIKSPTPVVFNYIADLRNWEQWGAWSEDDQGVIYNYPSNTSGIGSYFSWKSERGSGKIRTTYLSENDSIVHQVANDANQSRFYWKFKDSIGGTKITWKASGKLAFMDKIDATLQGGAASVFGNLFEKSLSNIDNNLGYEINTYNLALNGIVQREGVNYLKQTINSKISDYPRNLRIMLTQMRHFFNKNQIKAAGKPFVIYHSYNAGQGTTKFSVCMPVAEEIHTAPDSDVTFDQLPDMSAIKTTLTGDYSHLQKAWLRATDYINKNGLRPRSGIVAIENLKVGSDEAKQPSKWVTEVFIPIELPAVRDTVPSPPIPGRRPVVAPVIRDTSTVSPD